MRTLCVSRPRWQVARKDARQHLLSDRASRGPIATTADLRCDHGAPECLFRTPVGRVTARIKQKREQRIPFAIQVPNEPGDICNGRPLLEDGAELTGQSPACHGNAMRGDVASRVAIPNSQCFVKNLLRLTRQLRARIVGAQFAAAAQQRER